MSRFEVQDVFTLSSRGGVLVGVILDGTLSRGHKAAVRTPDGASLDLEISSIEYVDDIDRGRARIGLLLQGKPAADVLSVLVPNGTILNFG